MIDASPSSSISEGSGKRRELKRGSGATKEKPRKSILAEGDTAVVGVSTGSMSVNS